jgi:hypothetical protein
MRAIVEGRDHNRTTSEEDRRCEAAVLHYVLALHPTPLTLADIVRELGGNDDFGQRDAVERAVRDLTGCGLLHRSEALVLPSHAALRFEELSAE